MIKTAFLNWKPHFGLAFRQPTSPLTLNSSCLIQRLLNWPFLATNENQWIKKG